MNREKPMLRSTVPISLQDLAGVVGGVLSNCSVDVLISGIASIGDAVDGQITFLSDAKNQGNYFEDLQKTKASAVIASKEATITHLPVIKVENPYEGLERALNLFFPRPTVKLKLHPTSFIHEEAAISSTATVGANSVVERDAIIGEFSEIGAQVYIGIGTKIGDRVRIHPQVVIHDGCIIGNGSVLNSGAIIGSDGFGFYPTPTGHQKIPQVGIVQIGENVEVGANVTIDRATMGKTEIGDGTKIDNLVQIAHNVKIGKHCRIVAQVGISGSTILEDNVTLAGQVGTVGHVRIGKGTTVAARGVVTQDVEPNSLVSGFPLKPHSEERKIMATLRRLPEMLKDVRRLKSSVFRSGEDKQ